jgi:hypothetical protein
MVQRVRSQIGALARRPTPSLQSGSYWEVAMIKIVASFEIDVDIEAWAAASNVSVEEAKDDVLEFFGGMDLARGQTYATQTAAFAIEGR